MIVVQSLEQTAEVELANCWRAVLRRGDTCVGRFLVLQHNLCFLLPLFECRQCFVGA